MKITEIKKILLPYKNIIFDFGGVLIDIDYNKTINKLSELARKDFRKFFSQVKQVELFNLFETGSISKKDFINNLKQVLEIRNIDNQEIVNAWNLMLGEIPQSRIDLLLELKNTNKKIYILSNINVIHEEYMTNYFLNKSQQINFYDLFDKVYFSHKQGMRKPDKNFFDLVFKEQNILKKETIFVDDTHSHCLSAIKESIPSFFLKTQNSLV